MSLSMFYAQVLGLYLFLVSLAMLIHQARVKKIMSETLVSHSYLFTTGCLSLLIGIIIVVTHNFWDSSWRVLITLVGWVALLQGVWRIFWPDHYSKMAKDFVSKSGYLVWSWIWLVVGIYLMWMGFNFGS